MTVPAVENFIKQINLCGGGGEIKKNFVKKKKEHYRERSRDLEKRKGHVCSGNYIMSYLFISIL